MRPQVNFRYLGEHACNSPGVASVMETATNETKVPSVVLMRSTHELLS